MKIIFCLLSILFSHVLCAQQNKFSGIWEGKINAGVSLRIAFHFSKDSSGKFVTTMDSPDQSAFGIATDETYINNDSVFTEIKKYKVSFSGKLVNDSTIDGFFKQTVLVPLQLKKVVKVEVISRPQTPLPPFPYNSEEISYTSGKNIRIAGTVTYPKTDPNVSNIKALVFPAILLITGSGPQNRDEEIMGHKPFAVIADFLTKKGFLVLRADDRGVGKSSGEFKKSTSVDFANDAIAGINYLKKRKDVDTARLGLLGHSEGGLIAPMVATKIKDISFLVLLAAPGIKPIDLMTEQNIAVINSMGFSKKTQDAYGLLYKKMAMAVVHAKDSVTSIKSATTVLNTWLTGKDSSILKELALQSLQQQRTYINNFAGAISGAWYKYFLQYDPAPVLKNVHAKVLALNGDKDIQVLSASNLAGIKRALKTNNAANEIFEIQGVNHLFQRCTKCTVNEYGELDETISPKVLELIGNWLSKNVL